jgi:predicted HicB family RNase H-like nuclease
MARTLREDQLVIRVSRSLKSELEIAAAADGRALSSVVRRVLVEWASQRVVDRETRQAA